MISYYELATVSYDDFAIKAWEKYYACEHKGATYYGNHQFQNIPWDIEMHSTTESDAQRNAVDKYYCPPDSNIVAEVRNYFDIDYVDVHFQNLRAGMLTTLHFDVNRSLLLKCAPEFQQMKFQAEDKHRYIVFLQDQQPGQIFQVGEEYVTWKAGDIMGFPWYMPHCTANCGAPDRYILSIIGLRDPDRVAT
jgi:hypothetical protein